MMKSVAVVLALVVASASAFAPASKVCVCVDGTILLVCSNVVTLLHGNALSVNIYQIQSMEELDNYVCSVCE